VRRKAENYCLPFLVEPPTETASLSTISGRRAELQKQLLTCAALLLRGFVVGGIRGFAAFCREFAQLELMDYSGGASPRKRLSDQPIYTSTEYSSELKRPLHNELSYSRCFPRYLFFWCDVPPTQGGETLLADGRIVLSDMPFEIVDEFETKKICYVRNLVSDAASLYSWQHAFDTLDQAEVESQCDALGATCSWIDNGSLRIEQIGPASMVHPETHEKVWFNQADGFFSDSERINAFPRLESRFGDGSPIPGETVERIRSILDRRTIYHRWQHDDILVIDNLLAAHGRAPFSGERRIATAMA